ncbi:LysR family transcriptional regulator [Sandarakinorhabdus oryzae]|uniref:LysR family transcriptional regulator n=1 Tax=Sandarakinorhabdus oryzae TaxID=2675220 RepID=UPI0018CC6EC2|nr:LysR family transcriptional regulator [Sandarakinorhabdus oryzae]
MDGLDWSIVRSFVALAREGSLLKAARRLGVTHPTVRRHLDELERAAGQPLFLRSPTGLRPTPLALAMLPAAEAMGAAFAYLGRCATGGDPVPSGTVRITASEMISAEVLPPILARLRADQPAITCEINATDAVEDLMRHDADIAVRMTRPQQPDLVARRIAQVELGLFAAPDWLTGRSLPDTLPALAQSGLIIGEDRGHAMRDWFASLGIAPDQLHYALKSDSSLVQLAGVAAGIGCGVVQRPIAAARSWTRLLPELALNLDIWLAVHPAQRDTPRVRAVSEALASGLQAYAKAT